MPQVHSVFEISLPYWLKNHPNAVSLVIALPVPFYGWLAAERSSFNVLQKLTSQQELGIVNDLYLSLASLGGIAAGFAGVVVIFGLQMDLARFRLFRQAGGRRLISNWISVIATPIVASFAAVAASVLLAIGAATFSGYVALTAAVLLAHSSVRSVWLLSSLAKIVDAEDEQTVEQSRTVAIESLFR